MLNSQVYGVLECPGCAGSLDVNGQCEDGHTVPVGMDGLWELHPTASVGRYNTTEMIARYLNYAFGYLIMRDGVGNGVSEALYRTLSDLCRDEASKGVILDYGCGVGRTSYDLGRTHPGSLVIGIDASRLMAQTALAVVEGRPVRCGWPDDGWSQIELRQPALANVTIFQADARLVKFRVKPSLIVANMLIDRLEDPDDVLRLLEDWFHLLRSGGALVLSTPFNWVTRNCWESFRGGAAQLANTLSTIGFDVEVSFEAVPYREQIDPIGTFLELPVYFVKARKR